MFYRDEDGNVVGVLTDLDMAEEWDGKDDAVVTMEEMQAYVERARAAMSNQPPTVPGIPVEPEGERAASPAGSDRAAGNGEHAAEEDREEVKTRQRAKYRTGTGPFMALDLLRPGAAPRHVYRHDLESFFWVLAWFCAVFDPKERKLRALPLWHQANLVDIGSAKMIFLQESTTFDRTFAKTDSAYRPFVDTWITEIRTEVKMIFQTSRTEREAVEGFIDAQKGRPDRNLVRSQRALQQIRMARQEANDLLDFDLMMGLLDPPAV